MIPYSRQVHKEAGFKREEVKRTITEIQVKRERSFKGLDALKHLTLQ